MKQISTRFSLGLVSLAVLTLGACTSMSSRNVADPTMPGDQIATHACSACHTVTGESISPQFPKLAGQQKDYIVAQLSDFKGHERSDNRGTQYMWGFTHLTNKQVDEIAEYFSKQAPMKGYSDHPERLARGEEIFKQGIPANNVLPCFTCHGPNAEGMGTFPRLAGQHAPYIVEQIGVFQLTDHRPRGAVMKQVTHEMSDADAWAIAEYLQSLGAK